MIKRQQIGVRKMLVTLQVDFDGAPAHGGSSVITDGKVVGTVTSRDWGHCVKMNLAYAFVWPECAEPGTHLEVEVIGISVAAPVIASGYYDPDNTRVKG